ncbi:hypothetical protein JCM3766R1_003498 [Sporobolomyces carnicolor]
MTSGDPKLPIELVLEVVRFVQDDAGMSNTRKRQIGRSVALTCRALRPIGTSIVWHEVRQKLGRDEKLLQRLLRDEAGHLAHVVQTLSIDGWKAEPRTKLTDRDVDAIVRFDNLRHVELHLVPPAMLRRFFSVSNDPSRSSPIHPIPRHGIRNPFGSSLRSMSIAQPSDEVGNLLVLVSNIGTLRDLKIVLVESARHGNGRWYRDDEEIAETSRVALSPIPLETLEVDLRSGTRLSTVILEKLLDELVVPDKLSSLSIRSSAGTTNETWLKDFPALESFSLTLPKISFRNHLPAMAEWCPKHSRLRSLVIDKMDPAGPRSLTPTVTSTHAVLAKFLGTLARSLERLELSIAFPDGAHEEPINSFLHDRRHLPLSEMRVVVRRPSRGAGSEYRGLVWMRKREKPGTGHVWEISEEGSAQFTYV